MTASATALASSSVSTTCGTIFTQRYCRQADSRSIAIPRAKKSA